MAESQIKHLKGLRCLDCHRELSFQFPSYRCPCGGNLWLEYDYAAIGRTFRRPTLQELHRLGHMAYSALLPIGLQEAERFSLTVGGSPLIRRPDLARQLGANSLTFKDDSRLPSASFKDRASSVLLAMAAGRGIDRVATASTGNAGCSMACLAADAGMEAWVFVPRTAPRAKVAQLLYYGARVVQVDGNYDDAFDLCWEMAQRYGWLNRSTGWNPFTREGKKTVAFEIVQQLEWSVPDLVFVPVGDGNIISGTWKGFQELALAGIVDGTPRMVAVQSSQSNAIAQAFQRMQQGMPATQALQPVAATTCADSISVDLPRDGSGALYALARSGGEAVEVSDDDICEAVIDLASRTGIFAEPAAATAWAGVMQYAREKGGLGGLNVVCLVTGNGLKDPETALAMLPSAARVPAEPDEAARLLGLPPVS